MHVGFNRVLWFLLTDQKHALRVRLIGNSELFLRVSGCLSSFSCCIFQDDLLCYSHALHTFLVQLMPGVRMQLHARRSV